MGKAEMSKSDMFLAGVLHALEMPKIAMQMETVNINAGVFFHKPKT